MRTWMGTVVTAAAGGAVTTALLLASGAMHTRGPGVTGNPPLAARGQLVAGAVGVGRLSAKEIYDMAAPAVVSVKARVVRAEPSPFAATGPPAGVSAGSGFVIDADEGLIIASAHVVAAAAEIRVTLPGGRSAPARTLGRDDDTDLALLAVDPEGLDLRALELDEDAEVEVGDPTLALGNRDGGQPTLTTGVVSAPSRSLATDDGFALDGVIQTDAPQSDGDAGGPLLDAAGRVVGVIGRLTVGGTAVGFALPAATVADVVPQLEESGRVRRAFLGIRPEPLDTGAGVRVGEVRGGSPAAAAGVRAGDTVRSVAGERVPTVDALSRVLEGLEPGDEVTLAADRGRRRVVHEVRLGDRPAASAER